MLVRNPQAALVGLAAGAVYHRARPMNQKRSQICIAALTDAEQSCFPATGTLLRYKAQPCSELPAIFECLSVADCRDQGLAVRGPIPSTAAIRWQGSLARWTTMICLSRAAIFSSNDNSSSWREANRRPLSMRPATTFKSISIGIIGTASSGHSVMSSKHCKVSNTAQYL